MVKPFLKNAWYVAAWSYEVKKELFERTIIGESILFYRKQNNQAVATNNACAHPPAYTAGNAQQTVLFSAYSLNAGFISVFGVQSGPYSCLNICGRSTEPLAPPPCHRSYCASEYSSKNAVSLASSSAINSL